MSPQRTLWLIVAFIIAGVIALFFVAIAVDSKIDANKQEISKLSEVSSSAIDELQRSTVIDINVSNGQEIYVPVYSELQGAEGRRTHRFAINLSIRNTDPDNSIVIEYIDYYDTEGNVVRKFGDGPVELGPMATKHVHIRQSDPTGGIGANFYLLWSAKAEVNEPIVEAVMIGTEGNHSYSWSTHGRVVKYLKTATP